MKLKPIEWKEGPYTMQYGDIGTFRAATIEWIGDRLPWRVRVTLFGRTWICKYKELDAAKEAAGEVIELYLAELFE